MEDDKKLEVERRQKISQAQVNQWKRYKEQFPFPQEGHKRCSHCKEIKYYNIDNRKVSDFSIRRYNAKSGASLYPRSWCKDCENQRNVENTEKMRREGKIRDWRTPRGIQYEQSEHRRRLKREWARKDRRRKREQREALETGKPMPVIEDGGTGSVYDDYAKAFPEGLYD